MRPRFLVPPVPTRPDVGESILLASTWKGEPLTPIKGLKPTLAQVAGLLTERAIDEHWELYEGYVKQYNALIELIPEVDKDLVAELSKRISFELNGVRLHEMYFENLGHKLASTDALSNAITEQFGSPEKWLEAFLLVAKTRGVGWTILARAPMDRLLNVYVESHNIGVLAGCKPLVVLDCWEHAYMLDYKATERDLYVEAFMQNINWQVADFRFTHNAG